MFEQLQDAKRNGYHFDVNMPNLTFQHRGYVMS